MSTCNTNPDCGVAVPTEAAPLATTPCPDRACPPSTSVCGDWTTSIAATGCTTRTRTSFNMLDGVYPNATLTLLNGCITAVAAGTRVLQSRPEPCATASGVPTPTPTPTLTLSSAPCNILSGNINNLYAGLTFNQVGQDITVTGCGTAASPAVIRYTGTVATVNSLGSSTFSVSNVGNAYTINSVGANQTLNCGYRIENGIVKNFIIPIHTLTAGRGVTVSPTVAGVNCDWTISTNNKSKVVMGLSCGTAFVDPNSGVSPPSSVWVQGSAVVYGSRLFLNTPYPAVVYDQTGATITTAPGFVTYASPALALTALDSVYSFSGTGAC